MSWKKQDVEEQKMLFISEWLKEEYSVTALCSHYGISRKTGYKLIHRYEEGHQEAFQERSRTRHTISNKTSEEVVEQILIVKQRYIHWGPIKLKEWYEKNHPGSQWPAASTIGEILKREGWVKRRRYRRHVPPYSQPFSQCGRVNQVWSADFKGQFRLLNGRYCYPLTVTDNYSRFLIGCEGLHHPRFKETQLCFEKMFYDYGLPEVIKTDNGQPFAGVAIGGLSQLSKWWLKLGIMVERIAPGCPEQNGRHERMHRTLKEATTKPSRGTLELQQECFDVFREEYNHERPHQSLNHRCPGEIYQASKRMYPSRLPEVRYPEGYEVRWVRSNGEIKWGGKKYFLSELLYGEPVGLEVTKEENVIIYFAKLRIGFIDVRKGKLFRKVE